jgi:HAD superfamily phosphoserine phosphatase-like hydrolase
VRENEGRIAAFFDLDGTLVAEPSLEREFFRELRWRGKIPVRNYFFWIAEALKLTPRGIETAVQGNKMYLKSVAAESLESIALKRSPRFYGEGIERVGWHLREGHAIYLVSGTLEGLAAGVGLALVMRLAVRGIPARIGYCATRLEEDCGRWTGKTAGEGMFGEAKARAIQRIAKQEGFSLEKSYAYGNSMSDRWMLAAVGRATAVNPCRDLERLAELNQWPAMLWNWDEQGEEDLTQRHRERRECKENNVRARIVRGGLSDGVENGLRSERLNLEGLG